MKLKFYARYTNDALF